MANDPPPGALSGAIKRLAEETARKEVHPALDRSAERLQAERDAALEWISQKWTEPRRCPVCATEDWDIQNIAQIPLYGASNQIYPVIPVSCKNCTYTMFFQAIPSGVILADDPPEPES